MENRIAPRLQSASDFLQAARNNIEQTFSRQGMVDTFISMAPMLAVGLVQMRSARFASALVRRLVRRESALLEKGIVVLTGDLLYSFAGARHRATRDGEGYQNAYQKELGINCIISAFLSLPRGQGFVSVLAVPFLSALGGLVAEGVVDGKTEEGVFFWRLAYRMTAQFTGMVLPGTMIKMTSVQRGKPIAIKVEYPGMRDSWEMAGRKLESVDLWKSLSSYDRFRLEKMWNRLNGTLVANERKLNRGSVTVEYFEKHAAREAGIYEGDRLMGIHNMLRRIYGGGPVKNGTDPELARIRGIFSTRELPRYPASLEEGVALLRQRVQKIEAEQMQGEMQDGRKLAAVTYHLFPRRHGYDEYYHAVVQVSFAIDRFRTRHGSLDRLAPVVHGDFLKDPKPAHVYVREVAENLGVSQPALLGAVGMNFDDLHNMVARGYCLPLQNFARLANLLELRDPSPMAYAFYQKVFSPYFKARIESQAGRDTVVLIASEPIFPIAVLERFAFGDFLRAHRSVQRKSHEAVYKDRRSPIGQDGLVAIENHGHLPVGLGVLGKIIRYFHMPRASGFLAAGFTDLPKIISIRDSNGKTVAEVQSRNFNVSGGLYRDAPLQKVHKEGGSPHTLTTPPLPKGSPGYRIEFERVLRGMGLPVLAGKVGCYYQTLFDIEHHRKKPISRIVNGLAEHLEIPHAELAQAFDAYWRRRR